MTPYFTDGQVTIYHGDCREILPAISANAFVTDPPYGVNLAARTTKRATRPARRMSQQTLFGGAA